MKTTQTTASNGLDKPRRKHYTRVLRHQNEEKTGVLPLETRPPVKHEKKTGVLYRGDHQNRTGKKRPSKRKNPRNGECDGKQKGTHSLDDRRRYGMEREHRKKKIGRDSTYKLDSRPLPPSGRKRYAYIRGSGKRKASQGKKMRAIHTKA